jgi:hypothetical protein
MKCSFLFSNVFFGILLILFGASLIIKVIFNIDIPVMKTVLALMLIYAGVSLIVGPRIMGKYCHSSYSDNSSWQRSSFTTQTDDSTTTYNVFMGKQFIDLSAVQTEKVIVNCTFGSAKIKINPTIPTQITINAGFAGAELPNGDSVGFGTYTYNTVADKSAELFITINVSAGGIKLIVS